MGWYWRPVWGGDMALTRRHPGLAVRLVLVTACLLVGTGAGLAAALATSDSWLVRAVGGAAGGIVGLASGASIDAVKQRRDAITAALVERGRVLDPVLRPAVKDQSPLGLLAPIRDDAVPFRGRAQIAAWLCRRADFSLARFRWPSRRTSRSAASKTCEPARPRNSSQFGSRPWRGASAT